MEYGSTSSLYEQLLQMRQTGVFIAVHTSNLANAPLLQPGSAVIEIIQVGPSGVRMQLPRGVVVGEGLGGRTTDGVCQSTWSTMRRAGP